MDTPSSAPHPCDAKAILCFWFEATKPKQWFRQSDRFDQCIRERFGSCCHLAQRGDLDHWAHDPHKSLALVLLLDQLSRHVWRGSARAYAGDAKAVILSLDAVQNGWIDQEPRRVRRQFWLMPLLHSEALADQCKAIELMARYTDPATAAVAQRHHGLIQRFGRFPHRNAILQRPNTSDEECYLRAQRRRAGHPSTSAPADLPQKPFADPPE